jgi:hypothetical protein
VKTRVYSCERERDTRQPAWVIGIEEKGLEDVHEYSQAGERSSYVYIDRAPPVLQQSTIY